VLHNFNGQSDGFSQHNLIPDGSGNFYGASNDTIFKLDRNQIFSVIGNLYGMTFVGGIYTSGSIFKVNIASGNVTLLYSFTGGTDGGLPSG
jgi:uncharacterized repeat protein (TIGR03803 family)